MPALLLKPLIKGGSGNETIIALPIPVGPPFVSPFLYSSYAEQQYEELVTLLDAAATTDSSILLGDFNHGPSVATPSQTGVSSIIYELPFNYGYVNARGYYSPFVILDSRCTICSENPAVSLTSKIVDHIYVPVTSSGRVVATKVGKTYAHYHN